MGRPWFPHVESGDRRQLWPSGFQQVYMGEDHMNQSRHGQRGGLDTHVDPMERLDEEAFCDVGNRGPSGRIAYIIDMPHQ